MVKGKIWFDFCPGYPGQPEIESTHYTEQSPGYGHPYLPGDLKTMKHKVYKHMHVHLQTPILMLTTSCGPGILPQTRCPSMSSVRSPWRQEMGSVLSPRRSTPASLSSDPPVSSSQSEPKISCFISDMSTFQYQGRYCVHHCDPAHTGVCTIWHLHHPGLPWGPGGQWSLCALPHV